MLFVKEKTYMKSNCKIIEQLLLTSNPFIAIMTHVIRYKT